MISLLVALGHVLRVLGFVLMLPGALLYDGGEKLVRRRRVP